MNRISVSVKKILYLYFLTSYAISWVLHYEVAQCSSMYLLSNWIVAYVPLKLHWNSVLNSTLSAEKENWRAHPNSRAIFMLQYCRWLQSHHALLQPSFANMAAADRPGICNERAILYYSNLHTTLFGKFATKHWCAGKRSTSDVDIKTL